VFREAYLVKREAQERALTASLDSLFELPGEESM
jgi:hypothetical protein